MKTQKRMIQFGTFLLVCGLLYPLLSLAVTRSTYFTQSARNVTVDGISSSAQSTCVVSISNPSSQSQNYTLQVSVNASGTAPGAGTFTDCSNGSTCTASGGAGGFTCSSSLAAGVSVSCTFTFPTYPDRVTVQAGAQTIVCAGSIVGQDTANPGFLIGGGSLVSFSESGALQTTNATGATTFFAGQAVYAQIPITVNGGKPF